MENNLQHEDLLIKLRAKLNEEKVKLWEAPYITADNEITQNFKVRKYTYTISLLLSAFLYFLSDLLSNFVMY